MAKNTIFVSCGQTTEAEKTLGSHIKATIDATDGFSAYFAETVQELEGLHHSIFDALRRAAGAVVVLHDRGTVLDVSGAEAGRRSSVWVQQELGILAYRQFFENRRLPLLCLQDPKVKLEGAMTSLIVNPRPLGSDAGVLDAVRAWLAAESFAGISDVAFSEKWNQLKDPARRVLSGIIEEGGHGVAATALKSTLRRLFGSLCSDPNREVLDAELQFQNTGLVSVSHTDYGKEFSLKATWEPNVRRSVAEWRQATSI